MLTINKSFLPNMFSTVTCLSHRTRILLIFIPILYSKRKYFLYISLYQIRTSTFSKYLNYTNSRYRVFYIYRGLFCCVGLPIVTSGGLADLLLCRTISPVIKSHSSESLGTHENGDETNASLNVRNEVSKLSTVFKPGGGDILRGLGDNLKLKNVSILSMFFSK